MASGTGNLPNQSMSFSPFAILTAEEMNDLVENIESLADGTGIGDGSVTTNTLAPGAATPEKRSGGFKIGVIPGSTFGSTGNKSITGLGFKPKKVRFMTLNTDNTTVFNGGWGAMDESGNQFGLMAWMSSSPTAGRMSFTNGCIGFLVSASSVGMKAAYVSMDADGFTINVSSASSAYDVGYEAEA